MILQVCFLLMILEKMTVLSWGVLKMSEIINSNMSNQTKFRLNKINILKTILTQKFKKEKQ